MVIALFDSDGTLYNRQFGRGMMEYTNTHGRKSFVRKYYASLVVTLALSKIKRDPDLFLWAVIERLPWLIKGYNHQEAMDAFQWVIDEYLLPHVREDVIERVKSHQSQGHEVVVVSGTFTEALEMLCQRLGVRHFVGTKLEVQNDRYTGRVIPPVIKGKGKVEQTHEYLKSQGWDIDWKSSYAYGDSFTDRDMLEMVGHAVAVHPEEKLFTLAREKDWDVLGEPKEQQ